MKKITKMSLTALIFAAGICGVTRAGVDLSGARTVIAASPSPVAVAASASSSVLTPEADFAAHYLDSRIAGNPSLSDFSPVDESYVPGLTPAGIYEVDDSTVENAPAITSRAGESASFTGGGFISIDNSVLNVTMSSPITITECKTDLFGEPVDNGWTITNLYGMGTSVFGTFNPQTSVLTIPAGQVIYKEDVLLVKLIIDPSTGKITVRKRDSITATLNADGSLTMCSWGVVRLTESGQAEAYNLFHGSRLVRPNLKVKGTDYVKDQQVERDAFIEQTGVREVMIYGMTGCSGDVVATRPTSSQTLVMSPQYISTMGIYGDFYIYDIDFATGKINRDKAMVFNKIATGYSIGGFCVATRTDDSGKTLALVMKDVTLETSAAITFPPAPSIGFAGEGTSASPYLIKTYADLSSLAMLVEDGNTFEGKYLALDNDINLSSLAPSDWLSIGDNVHQFKGSFDGRNHTLLGLKLEGRGSQYVGIFGYLGATGHIANLKVNSMGVQGSGDNIGGIAGFNEGLIENCHVTNSQLFTEGAMTGGIAGASSGIIRGCSFMGNIQGHGSQGGIAGQAINIISDCNVKANLKMVGYYTTKGRDVGGIAGVFSAGKMERCSVTGSISDTYGRGALGGIAGRTLNNGDISQCYSVAAITGKRLNKDVTSYLGGLTGMSYTAKFTNCYNAGTLMMNDDNDNIGGLIGNLSVSYTTSGSATKITGISVITNCYNSGHIIAYSNVEKKGIYGTTFVSANTDNLHPEDVCLFNCFYDRQVNTFGEDKYGRDTKTLLGVLPEGFSADVWTAVPNGYPVLKIHKDQSYALLSAAAPILKDGQTAAKVKVGFDLTTPASGLYWDILDNNSQAGFSTETAALKVTGNSATVKDQYANELVAAHSADGWGFKIYRFALVPKIFDGEGTAESPYLLKTPEDFIKLNQAVSSYAQPHSGDFFAMTNDIDFKLGDSFHGIGYGKAMAVEFDGVLDGRDHYIRGLKIDGGYNPGNVDETALKGYLGLFNMLGENGVLKNIRIASDCSFNFYIYSGPVVAFNKGRVENCRNYAPVIAYERQVGGVVGINYDNAVISACYNSGDITSFFGQAGGIASYNCVGSVIEKSQNDGEIITLPHGTPVNKASYDNVGGIVAYNYGSMIANVNQGHVCADKIVGGIIAYNTNAMGSAVVKSNFNSGLVECRTSVTTRGAIVGQMASRGEMADNTFDASINVNGAANNAVSTGFSSSFTSTLTSGKAITGLPADVFDFKAGKYPVLKNFVSEPASDALRSMFVNFADKQLRTNLTGSVALSTYDNLRWTISQNDNFTIEGSTVKGVTPTGLDLAAATLTASVNGTYNKVYEISAIPEILKGKGSAEDPYLIENKADWFKLADFMANSRWEYSNSYFKLTNDLDFGGDSLRVVAHSGVNFNGIFEGGNHRIAGFKYSNNNGFDTRIEGPNRYIGKNIGLFGGIGSTGVVRNLTVAGDFQPHSESGAVVGNLYGRLENIVYEGNFSTHSNGGCAGIAYRVYEGGVISNCVNKGTLKPYSAFCAGIAWMVNEGALVENCYNRGTIDMGKNSFACGIAGTVAGLLKNCHNEKPLLATSSIYGICYRLYDAGSLENCSNTADLDVSSTGSNVAGLFDSSDASTGGHVTGCFNSGTLSGKSNVDGICSIIGAQMAISDCYNSGDIIATSGRASGFAAQLNGVENVMSTLERCYNTGNINSGSYSTAGLVSNLKEYATIRDCYNLGDITVNTTTQTGNTTAGIAAEARGTIDRCFNTGNISANVSSVGGIAGFTGSSAFGVAFTSRVTNSFNLGDITVVGSMGNTSHGRGGGISGSSLNTDVEYVNCYNMGNVTGDTRLGGIVGMVFSTKAVVERCYNAGRVTSTTGAATPDISYTVYAKAQQFNGEPFYKNFLHVYYDSSVNPGKALFNVPGSAKTTAELDAIDMGAAYVKPSHGGYPILKAFGETHVPAAVSGAMIMLYNPDRENHDAVYDPVTLIGPADAVWTSEQPSVLAVDGNVAKPLAVGSAALVCTDKDGKYSKRFILTVDPSKSSVTDRFADKTIDTVTYIDLSGRQVDSPAPGNVYIVRTVYTDGTMQVAKVLIKD